MGNDDVLSLINPVLHNLQNKNYDVRGEQQFPAQLIVGEVASLIFGDLQEGYEVTDVQQKIAVGQEVPRKWVLELDHNS